MRADTAARDDTSAASAGALLSAAAERHRAGDLAVAETLYRRVLTLRPGLPDALHLLGVVLGRRGESGKAERLMREALAAAPERPHYLSNLANHLRRQGRHGEALSLYARAARINPNDPDIHANCAGALLGAGLAKPAEVAARRALALAPDHPTGLVNLGGALVGQLRFEEAEAPLADAARLGADGFDLWLNLAHREMGRGRHREAVEAFRRACALQPDSIETQRWLGFALVQARAMGEAKAVLERVVERSPTASSAVTMLGHLHMLEGDYPTGTRLMRRGLERPGATPGEHSTFLFDLNYDPALEPAAVLDEHRTWASRHASPLTAPVRTIADPDPERRLRVGIISPDLRAHAVSFFLLPVLRHLPRDRFEVVAYANVLRPDGITERLRELCADWHDIWGVPDRSALRQMRDDRLDILIDLAGHTADARLPLLAHRPAPVQVTYLGYPNTTGMSQVDWRIVDRWTDPPDGPWYGTERPHRLDRCFLCFDPQVAPPIGEPPCLGGAPFTFGSFNNLAKVNRRVIGLWARVLTAVPGSRLLLKHDVSHDPLVQARLRDAFGGCGVDPSRIAFLERCDSYGDHLSAYAAVDVGLDPFPYNGTTTTCEALWMGVPVITLAGRTHASRVGLSLLTSVGLGSTIATDEDDYVRTAVELARTPALLRVLRGMLRDEMQRSPLLDQAGHAGAIAAALRHFWTRACVGDRGPGAEAMP